MCGFDSFYPCIVSILNTNNTPFFLKSRYPVNTLRLRRKQNFFRKKPLLIFKSSVVNQIIAPLQKYVNHSLFYTLLPAFSQKNYLYFSQIFLNKASAIPSAQLYQPFYWNVSLGTYGSVNWSPARSKNYNSAFWYKFWLFYWIALGWYSDISLISLTQKCHHKTVYAISTLHVSYLFRSYRFFVNDSTSLSFKKLHYFTPLMSGRSNILMFQKFYFSQFWNQYPVYLASWFMTYQKIIFIVKTIAVSRRWIKKYKKRHKVLKTFNSYKYNFFKKKLFFFKNLKVSDLLLGKKVPHTRNNIEIRQKTSYSLWRFGDSQILNNTLLLLYWICNPFLVKIYSLGAGKNFFLWNARVGLIKPLRYRFSNLIPTASFRYVYYRNIANQYNNATFYQAITPWYYHHLIRFIQYMSGRRVFFQFYPFLNQEIKPYEKTRYWLWMPRMGFYERKLGHKFFLEESLYIIHLSLSRRDIELFTTWLKTMILRISFWKTKLIFFFLKFAIDQYFYYIFTKLNIKGIKIRLKGKISVAGNSRKRVRLYRFGQTSYSNMDLKVLHSYKTISTFTGVLGFQVWFFY